MKKLMRVFGSISNISGENRRTRRSSSVSTDGEVDPNNPKIVIEDRGSRRSSAIPSNLATYTSYKRSSLDSLDQINNHLLRFPEKLVIDSFFSKVHKAAYDGDMGKLTKNAKKVSVSLPDSNGRTALHLAASRGRSEAVTYLLSVGAEIDAVDEFGSTSLLEAIKGGQKDTVLLLLKKRASLALCDSEGNSALHFTCLLPPTSSSTVILEAVIKRDRRGDSSLIETVNDIGRTALHFACLRANMPACVKLLERGASVNCSDKEGVTALMLAAQSGNVQVIDCLLNYSANAFLKDTRDYTAEDYAKLSGNDYVMEMLNKVTEDGIRQEEDTKVTVQDAEVSGGSNAAFEEQAPTGGKEFIKENDLENCDITSIDSWGDNSNSPEMEDKPKLTKYLPESPVDDPDLPTTSTDASKSNMRVTSPAPPKPPRLNASNSSSLFSLDDIECKDKESRSDTMLTSMDTVKENIKISDEERSENIYKENDINNRNSIERKDSNSTSYNNASDSVSLKLAIENKLDVKEESSIMTSHASTHYPQDISACNKSFDNAGKGSFDQDLGSLESHGSKEKRNDIYFEDDILDDIKFDSSEEITFSDADDQILDGNAYFNTLKPKINEAIISDNILTESTLKLNECFDEEFAILDQDDPKSISNLDNRPKSSQSSKLGTLGRVDTLHGVEEMWEANPSFNQLDAGGNSGDDNLTLEHNVGDVPGRSIEFHKNSSKSERSNDESLNLSIFENESSSVNGLGSLVLSGSPTELDRTLDENVENLPSDIQVHPSKSMDDGDIMRNLDIVSKSSFNDNLSEPHSSDLVARSVHSKNSSLGEPAINNSTHIASNSLGKIKEARPSNVKRNKSLIAKAKESFNSRKDSLNISDLFTVNKFRKRSTSVSLDKSYSDIKLSKDKYWRDRKRSTVRKNYSFDGYERFTPLRSLDSSGIKENVPSAEIENLGNEPVTYFGNDSIDASTPRDKLETEASDSESECNFQVEEFTNLMIPLSQLESSFDLPENVQFLLRKLRLQLIKDKAKKEENDVKVVILKRNKVELENQLKEIENTNTELMCKNIKMNATNQLLAYQKNARTEDVVVYENFLLQLEKVCEGLRQQVSDLKNKNVMKAIKLDELTVQMEIICEINDKLQLQRAKKFQTTNSECQVDIEVMDFACQVTPSPSLTYPDSNFNDEGSQTVEVIGPIYEDFSMQSSLPSLQERFIVTESKSQSTQVELPNVANDFNENCTQTTPRNFTCFGLQTDAISVSEFGSQTEINSEALYDLSNNNTKQTNDDIEVFDSPHVQVYRENLPCSASIQTVKDPVKDSMSQTGEDWQLTTGSQTENVLYENKNSQTYPIIKNISINDNFTEVDDLNTENVGIQTDYVSESDDEVIRETQNVATQTKEQYDYVLKNTAEESMVSNTPNLMKNHISLSMDSIDIRSIRSCDCLNVQSVKCFNISKDSLFKNFNVESPRGTVSKVSFYSSPPESPKRIVSPKLVNDSIERLERIMTKIRDIEEDSLNKQIQSSENRRNYETQEHNLRKMNSNFNELVVDMKEEMTNIKNDIQDFMKDRDYNEKVSYADLMRNLKEENFKTSGEMIATYNDSLNALKCAIENGIQDMKLAQSDDTSDGNLHEALNDLNSSLSKQINRVADELATPLNESINSKIGGEMKEMYSKISEDIQNESKKVIELENDLLTNFKALEVDFKVMESISTQGFENLKNCSESAIKPVSDEFQELQQKIFKQQHDILEKVSDLSSTIQHEDSLSQRTRYLVEDADEKSSQLTDLIHENEKLRRDLDNEKSKVYSSIEPQYSVLEHNFQSIDSVVNGDLISASQIISNTYPRNISDVSPSTKERKYLKDIEEIKASKLITDGKLQEVEQKNVSLENRLTFTQMLLSEEEKKVINLKQEIKMMNQDKVTLEKQLFIRHEDKAKQQETSRRLLMLTNDKEEKEFKLKTLSEQIDQKDILIKNKDVKISQLEKRLNLVSRSNFDLQSEVQSLTMSIFTADEKQKRNNTSNLQLKKELEILKLSLQEKESSFTEYESKIRDYRNDINKKHSTQQQLQKDLDNLSDAVTERDVVVNALEKKLTDMKKQVSINNSVNREMKEKLANMSEEKNNLSSEIQILKERSISSELDRENSDFNLKLLKKYQDDYNELQEKISSDYIPKSSLKIYEQEIESKYQLKLNEKISNLQIAAENSQSRELFLKESFAATEENLRKEMDNLSEEVLRLRARLSLRSDRSDIWRKRHDQALKHLRNNQEKLSFETMSKNTSDFIDNSNIASNSKELELSDIRQRLDKSSRIPIFGRHSLQEPLYFEDEYKRKRRGPVDLIDSCYRSHSRHLERSLNQIYDESHGHFASSEKFSDPHTSSYEELDKLCRFSSKDIGNPLLSSTLIEEERDRDSSCSEYTAMLRKKYSV